MHAKSSHVWCTLKIRLSFLQSIFLDLLGAKCTGFYFFISTGTGNIDAIEESQ